MKRGDDMPMYDDPSESAFVRELLQAGRRANSDYDVERGLARHLAGVAATASVPVWSSAAKSALPAWLGYVALPLAAASVAGLLWLFAANPGPAAPEPARAPAGAPARPLSAHDQFGPSAAEQTDHAEAPGLAPQRRGARPASRGSAPHAASRPQRSGVSSRALPEGASASSATVEATEATPANSQDFVLPSGNPYLRDSSASPAASNNASNTAQAPVARPEPEPTASATASEPEPPTEAPAPKGKGKAAAAPVIDESRLEREMQMLAVTQRVLSSDPQRALRLAQQGEREFPDTMFSAERRQLGLLALVKLGRLDEARRTGRPFLARYPNAPWSERLRRALATGQVE